MPNHRIHKGTRLYNRVFAFSLMVIMFLIVLMSYWTFRNIAGDMIHQNQQILGSQVRYLQESIGGIISNTTGRIETLLCLTRNQKDVSIVIQQELNRLVDADGGIPRIWLYHPGEKIYRNTGTSFDYLEAHSWWKPYTDSESPNDFFIPVPGETASGFLISQPYRDEMDLDTLLPVVVYFHTKEEPPSLAFVEFDLTMVLFSRTKDFRLNLYETAWPLEILIYDKEGMLLETSGNLPLQTQSLLQKTPRIQMLNVSFEDRQFRNGNIYYNDKGHITVYSRNTNLGLIFCGRIPSTGLTTGAMKAASYVLIIGLVCLLTVFLLSLIIANLFLRMKQYQHIQAQARFETLQARMNPHFLFNTLDSLLGVAEQKNYLSLIEMIRSISYILHINLRKSGDFLMLSEELRYIKSYVHLQEIRYRDQFSFELHIPNDGCDDGEILKYCIQPLVENSFIHAVHLREKIVHISLDIERRENSLKILLQDDGPGCSEKTRRELKRCLSSSEPVPVKEASRHLGILSIHHRISMLYDSGYGITLPDADRGFIIELLLPLRCRNNKTRFPSIR